MPVPVSGVFARGRLPYSVDDMVGRRVEIGRVLELLRGNRLVTLTGAGGIGKTRLAVEVARSAVGSLAEEGWLVELAEVADPGLVGQAVASALGLVDTQGAGVEEVLGKVLADRAALLLLDNCEHLLDPTARLVEQLLRRCAGLRVLVTSREWLRVPGEATFEVPTLGLPRQGSRKARTGSGRSVVEGPAVELFTRRAVEVAPGFTVGDGNRDAVEQIVDRLDGLPLAIELAAARLRTLSVGELAVRLSDRYRVLSGTRRGVVPHHQTMRMCVDWSYELCSHLEQLLWNRASVFVGSFDLEAVESVCGFGALDPATALDLVTGLLDKSVLMRADEVSGEGSGDGARFRLLETLREYGRERLRADGEEDQVLDRHRGYYTELVAATSKESHGVVDHDWPGWLRLDLDLPNLRLMLDASHGSHLASAPPLRTCVQLRLYWYTRGLLTEARQHIARALAADTTPSRDRALLLTSAAAFARAQGDDEAWQDACDQLVTVANASGDRLARGVADYTLGIRLVFLQQHAEAITLLQSAVEVLAEEGGEARHYGALVELHTAAAFSGDTGLAERVYGEAVEIAEQRDGSTRAFLDMDHALVKMATGENDEAVRLEFDALSHFAATDHHISVAYALEAMALILHSVDRVELAVLTLGGALQRNEKLTARALLPQYAEAFAALESDGRAKLGDDGFEETLRHGAELSDAELVAAIAGDRGLDSTDAGRGGILTPRELEVAALVADGLTNRAIADRLFVTPRTVRGHIENILAKLNMESRVQIATWHARFPRSS